MAGSQRRARELRAWVVLAWRAERSRCARSLSAAELPVTEASREPATSRTGPARHVGEPPVSLDEVLAWTAEAFPDPPEARRARRRAWMPAQVRLDVQVDSERTRLDELRVEQDFDAELALDGTDLRDQDRWGDATGTRVRGSIAWDLRDAVYSSAEASLDANEWRRRRARAEAIDAASDAWERWVAAWRVARSPSTRVAAEQEMMRSAALLDVFTEGRFGRAWSQREVEVGSAGGRVDTQDPRGYGPPVDWASESRR